MSNEISDQFDLQIIISTGPDTPGRAIVGHSMAASAAAMGLRVLMFLAYDGAEWGTTRLSNREDVGDVEDLINHQLSILEADGRIEVCSACGERLLREGVKLRPGVELGGLTSVASRAIATQTVSF